MSWSEWLKEFEESIDLSKRFPGYFNKWVFRGMMLAIVVVIVLAGQSVGWKLSGRYIECRSEMPCFNPLYDKNCAPTDGVCSLQTLMPGTLIGDRPTFLVEYADTFVLSIILLAFGVNHLVYEVRRR